MALQYTIILTPVRTRTITASSPFAVGLYLTEKFIQFFYTLAHTHLRLAGWYGEKVHR